MKKFLVALAALVMGSAIAVFGMSNPAQAASCPTSSGGYLCFYNDTAGNTLISYTLVSSIPRTQCRALAGSENNSISYVKNTSASMFWVYNNGSCSGTAGPIYAHSEGAMNATWNNVISSYFKQ